MNKSEDKNRKEKRKVIVIGSASAFSTGLANALAEYLNKTVTVIEQTPSEESYNKGITTEKEKDIMTEYRNNLISDYVGIYPRNEDYDGI